MKRVRSLLVAVLTVALLGVTPALGQGRPDWVHTWTSMPQLTEPHNLPPAPFTQDDLVMDDTTLRQTVRVTTGGRQVRLATTSPTPTCPAPPRPTTGTSSAASRPSPTPGPSSSSATR